MASKMGKLISTPSKVGTSLFVTFLLMPGEEHLTSCSVKKLFESVLQLAGIFSQQLCQLGKFANISKIVYFKNSSLLEFNY